MFVCSFWGRGPLMACLLAGALLVAGCSRQAPVSQSAAAYAANAKRAYEEAIEAYLDRDWELARELFDSVTRNYGYSRYARLSQLRLADIEFHQDNFIDAVGDYKSFVHDFPNDPEVRYARFRLTQAQFAQASEGLLMPPLEERELDFARDAYASIQAYVADYPNDERSVEIEYMRQVVMGLLARHELYVARYYLRMDEFQAAVARCRYALDNYAGSGLDAEALVLLGEVYLMMKKQDDARSAFEKVLKEHSASAFVVPARNFLDRIAKAPKAVAKSPN